MNETARPAHFFSYRTLRGLLAGILAALIFTIFFKQPSLFTPQISLILAIMISGLSTPKHLAVLGGLIGIPVGFVAGIQFILPDMGQTDGAARLAEAWIKAYFSVSFIMIFWTAYFAFLGFLSAQLMKLYKRGSIF